MDKRNARTAAWLRTKQLRRTKRSRPSVSSFAELLCIQSVAGANRVVFLTVLPALLPPNLRPLTSSTLNDDGPTCFLTWADLYRRRVVTVWLPGNLLTILAGRFLSCRAWLKNVCNYRKRRERFLQRITIVAIVVWSCNEASLKIFGPTAIKVAGINFVREHQLSWRRVDYSRRS